MKNLLTLVSFVLICHCLGATTYTFTAASGDWNDTSNWDSYPGTTVNSGDEVIIDGICTIPSSLNVRNEGTLTVNSGAEIITTSGGPIFLNFLDANMIIDGKLTTNNTAYNQGTVTINGELISNHVYINFDTFINNGKVVNQGNQYSNSGNFTNNGEFVCLTTMSSQDVFDQLGTYSGNDDFHLDPFNNQGTIAPGTDDDPIGLLTFNVDYSENGTYAMDIAGDAGEGLEDGNDLIHITKNTNLSGTLLVQLQNAYVPIIGDEFTILTSSMAISGTYNTTIFPSLPSGRSMEVIYNTFNIKVKVVAGDPPPNTKTYYISSSTGNDNNSGLSPTNPWQTLSKMASIVYETGDSVLLKKGDTWEGISQYFSRSFVYIGAYGSSENFPIITNLQSLPNVTDAYNWTVVNGLWECSLPLATTRLFVDDQEILKAALLSEVGVADSEGYIPKWFHDGDKLFIDHPSNPATAWTDIKGSQNYITFNMEGSSDVTIEGIAVEGATGPSLQLANCQNIQIENCQLGKNAASALLLVNGSNNNIITDNTIDSYYTQMYGIGTSTDRGCRDGIRLANDASYNTIENNTIKNWSHYGIELLNTFNSSEGVNHNTIRYNNISAPDIPYAHPIGTDGPSGRCNENEIGYNFISDCRTTCQINGEDNRFHHNILKHFRQSPAKNTFSAHAITIAAYDVLDIGNVSRNNIFENNLIMDSDEAAFRFDDQGFNILVDSIFVRNNIIIDSGLDPINGEYNEGTAIYFDDSEYMNDIFFENNLFFQNTIFGDVLYKVMSNEYIDVDQLNLLHEIDGIKANQNLKADPKLDIDYTPLDESLAVNNGLNNRTLEGNADYYNRMRIKGGIVDIGPVENQNNCNERSIIFVDSLAVGGQTGHSWRNAFLTITDALDACPEQEDKSFWVAKGHYYPTDNLDQSISFSLNSSSKLFGGFIGNEILVSERNISQNQTILSGDIGIQNEDSDNSNIIILQASENDILFDGIYIEDANSTTIESAVDLGNSSITLSNSIIQNNNSEQYAAIHCDACSLTLESVEIINNLTVSSGIISISPTGFIEVHESIIEGKIDVQGTLEISGNTTFKE